MFICKEYSKIWWLVEVVGGCGVWWPAGERLVVFPACSCSFDGSRQRPGHGSGRGCPRSDAWWSASSSVGCKRHCGLAAVARREDGGAAAPRRWMCCGGRGERSLASGAVCALPAPAVRAVEMWSWLLAAAPGRCRVAWPLVLPVRVVAPCMCQGLRRGGLSSRQYGDGGCRGALDESLCPTRSVPATAAL